MLAVMVSIVTVLRSHLDISVVQTLKVWLGTVDQPGDVLPVLGHDELQGVLNISGDGKQPTTQTQSV